MEDDTRVHELFGRHAKVCVQKSHELLLVYVCVCVCVCVFVCV
jgi:hypothetical protein